jgi:hypothetical protein
MTISFSNVATRQEVMASRPPAELIVQGMQQQYGDDLLMINLGQLNLQSEANDIVITLSVSTPFCPKCIQG